MKLFRDYRFNWWQIALFKFYLVSGGLLIGAYFSPFVLQYKTILLLIFSLTLVYFLYALVMKKI